MEKNHPPHPQQQQPQPQPQSTPPQKRRKIENPNPNPYQMLSKTERQRMKQLQKQNKKKEQEKKQAREQTPFRRAEKKYKLYKNNKKNSPPPILDFTNVTDLRDEKWTLPRGEKGKEGERGKGVEVLEFEEAHCHKLSDVFFRDFLSPPCSPCPSCQLLLPNCLHNILDLPSSSPSSPPPSSSPSDSPPKPTLTQIKAYEIEGVEGLYVLPSALSLPQQLVLAKTALGEYAECPPNVSNVTNLKARKTGEQPQNMNNNQNLHDFVGIFRGYSLPLREEKKKELEETRWVTLGYNYDWTTRTYSPAEVSPLPPPLHSLGATLANPFGLKFNSEAVIVNFYHLDSMLCGHFDDAEQTTTSFPLVSISLGCSAVFLIAPSKDVDPVPLLLRSGDVVIMSGPSRNYYHGVPRIIENTFLPEFQAQVKSKVAFFDQEDEAKKDLGEREREQRGFIETISYLQQNRVNLNVRQVFEVEDS